MTDKTNIELPIIYTTGAFLCPRKFFTRDGEETWCWVVEEFTDDSYYAGNVFNPPEFGRTKTELTRQIE